MSEFNPRAALERPLDFVRLGPQLGADVDRRLVGDVRERKILELGCGSGHIAVGLAQRGARVIATDHDPAQLFVARSLASREDVAVEFHETGPAELAFIRADQIDLAISVWSLSLIDDLDRVLRQVHRVLRPGGHLIVSLPHPAALCADPTNPTQTVVAWHTSELVANHYVHTAENLVTACSRTNFAVELLLERHSGGLLPTTLTMRARRLGA